MTNALALSIVTTTGVGIVFKKLPPKLQQFIIRQQLLTEITTMLLAYIVLGGTLTALMASALVGLEVSLLLYVSSHPEQFEYLNDLEEAMKDFLTKCHVQLMDLGRKYREYKQEKLQQEPLLAAT